MRLWVRSMMRVRMRLWSEESDEGEDEVAGEESGRHEGSKIFQWEYPARQQLSPWA